MLWCEGAQNIGLPNRTLKFALIEVHRMITVHARPSQTDRRTDERHGNSATIRSMNASRAKNR